MSMLRRVVQWIAAFIRALLDSLFGPPAPPPPTVSLSSVWPLEGWPGSLLTLEGSGFSPDLDGNAVTVGGVAALVARAAPTQLEVLVGEGATSGPIVVTVGGLTATALQPFAVAPWPDVRDGGRDGAPIFFHGPQHGTPALRKTDQRVLVILTFPTDHVPADKVATQNAETASFDQARRFWAEASYWRTTFKFEFSPWVDLRRPRIFYIWEQGDIDKAREDLLRVTKRHAVLAGGRVYAAQQGLNFSIIDVGNPDNPYEVKALGTIVVPMHVAVGPNFAYVAAGDQGLYVVYIGPPTASVVRQIASTGWLHGVDIAGTTLVTAATRAGIEVYDLSVPDNPVRKSVFPVGGRWATAVRLVGTKAYVGATDNTFESFDPTLRVIDVSNLAAPVEIGGVTVGATGAWVMGLDVAGTTCVVATDGDGLHVFDVSGAVPVLKGIERSVLRLHSVTLVGTTAYGAGADQGLVIWDVADPANPKLIGTHVGAPGPGYDCYGIAAGGGNAYLSLGAKYLQVVGLGDPAHPADRGGVDLTGTFIFGANPNLSGLRDSLRDAIVHQNLIKHEALFVDALQRLKAIMPSFDIEQFEGFVTVLNGPFGRAQSSNPANVTQVSFEGTTIKFQSAKGRLWIATGSSWGRKAHELGHWFLMPDIYTEKYDDGTMLVGDAEHWDLAGDADEGALFSGAQADHMQLFDGTNVVRRSWDPGSGSTSESFEIVAHDASEDGGPRIHLLELDVADGLSYYVEVRQKPGTVIFDANIPAGNPQQGAVLVTRARKAETFINNANERSTMLFGVLDVGQSAVDPPRLLRIECAERLQDRPLVYRVVIHWNEEPPPNPDGTFDLSITPWSTETWESVDIWIDSPRNNAADGTVVYEFHEDGKPGVAKLSGDRPWVKHVNSVHARIHNTGGKAAAQDAKDVWVSLSVTSPPGIGDNGVAPDGTRPHWTTIQTKKIDSVAANSVKEVTFNWTPDVAAHTCLTVAIMPQFGEIEPHNNRAQENVANFDSPGGSSHEPVILDAEVRSPFSVVRKVDLVVRGLPEGWHAVVDHAWTWLGPKGAKPVRVIAWTDLHSPRAHERQQIPDVAFPRVEGWTNFDHIYVPIGGILMPVKANARVEIVLEARPGPRGLIVEAVLHPAIRDVPIAVEVTDSRGDSQILHGITDTAGRCVVQGLFAAGTYRVQAFSASTRAAAEAASARVTAVVP
jgi:hypothetical protein